MFNHPDFCRILKEDYSGDLNWFSQETVWDISFPFEQIEDSSLARGIRYGDYGHCYTLKDAAALKELSKFKNLRSLKINFLLEKDISFIPYLPTVKNLTINCSNIQSMEWLENLPALEELSIGQCSNIRSLEGINKLHSLQHLFIESCSNLNGLHGIETLSLGMLCMDHTPISDFYCLRHMRMDKLKLLNIKSCGLNNISDVKYCPNLMNLSLNHNHINYLDNMERFPNLQHLSLADNRIKDISSISSLSKLVTLDVRENRIVDVSCLQKLKYLGKLNVSDNNITSLAFTMYMQSLRALDFDKNDIGKEERYRIAAHFYDIEMAERSDYGDPY